jgi:hypothetical protein
MCADLFALLCENGGPEQKVIIFCTREIHADRVAQHMNNLYVRWCKENGQEPKDHYAFKCMGGANNGADMIEPMRGSSERAFIACTVDLLEAGVDIERLNAVVFFRYLQSPIKFYQMVGRGTRIHEETQKYKFWLYDYTDVTSLFGTDFITKPPRPGGGGKGGGEGPGGGGEKATARPWPRSAGSVVIVYAQGRFILSLPRGPRPPNPGGRIPSRGDPARLVEAHNLDEFRAAVDRGAEAPQPHRPPAGRQLQPRGHPGNRPDDRLRPLRLLRPPRLPRPSIEAPERGALFISGNQPGLPTWTPRLPSCSRGWATSSPQAAPMRWKPRHCGKCPRSGWLAGLMRCACSADQRM